MYGLLGESLKNGYGDVQCILWENEIFFLTCNACKPVVWDLQKISQL